VAPSILAQAAAAARSWPPEDLEATDGTVPHRAGGAARRGLRRLRIRHQRGRLGGNHRGQQRARVPANTTSNSAAAPTSLSPLPPNPSAGPSASAYWHVSGHPVVLAASSLAVGPAVGTDTPGLQPRDLYGDNRIDLYGLQNNYDPDYASGDVQWQTWRRSNDETSFSSTGCGPLSSPAPAAPVALLTGSCSS
jgi:hypothetical protein